MSNQQSAEYPIDDNETARLVGWSVQTLRSRRSRGQEVPPYRRIGRKIISLRSEVIAWRDQRLVTSDPEAA